MKRILLLLMISLPVLAGAQSDWGSSLSVDISRKLFPKTELSFEEDFRLYDNFSKAERFSHCLEISYKPWKFLKGGGAYNLINYNHPTKGWEIRHRYYFYATGDYTLNRFNFSLRERFQSTYRQGIEATEKRANPKNYLRSRFQVEYDLKGSHFEPFLSVELYNTLNDPQENKLNKVRYQAGTAYHVNKRNSLEFYYRYTNFLEDDDVSGKNMICFAWSFSLGK